MLLAALTLSLALGAAPAAEPARDTEVIVFVRSLKPGAKVTADDLAKRKVPARLATKSVVRPGDLEVVLGQTLGRPVDEPDLLRWADLVSEPDAWEACRPILEQRGKAKGAPHPKPFDTNGATLRSILVAARDVEQGRALAEDDLAVATFKSDLVGAHEIESTDRPLVLGQKLLAPVLQGDPIRYSDLPAYSDDGRCAALVETIGNLNELKGPPEEAKKLACPKGTASIGGIAPVGKYSPLFVPGWFQYCQKATGERHGPFASWSRTRVRYEEGQYQDGKRTGVWKQYSEDGRLRAETTWKDGRPEGPAAFYSDSEKRSGRFAAGLREGDWTFGSAVLHFKKGIPAESGREFEVMVASPAVEAGAALRPAFFTPARRHLPEVVASNAVVPRLAGTFLTPPNRAAWVIPLHAPLFFDDVDEDYRDITPVPPRSLPPLPW